MKQLFILVFVVLGLAACGKDKPKAVVAVADAGSLALKQDDELAAKLAASYPRIRCALSANQHAVESLYKDAGFADGPAYFKAFAVQADANPTWARKVTAEALAKPCVEPAVPAPPSSAPAAPPSTGNTP